MTILIVHLTSVSPKRYRHVSSESIENILYYKDCNHKQTPTMAPVLRSPPEQQECKMQCKMCCGDQCVDSQNLSLGRQMQGQNHIEPKMSQPNIKPPTERRKKIRPQMPSMPPIPQRRGLALTRENVKSLISKDEDIKKILRDLVRVAMQKVDLMQLLSAKQNVVKTDSDRSADVSDSENDL
ncbi:unnamed protein product [Euphydryas editha]|uniref:Uncharacterized protein n=1 Tax=Euphydryas editha TaxID=104508 RepID=A0AAU9TI52_EUPED|nr:unnamed protein product [Euphydryas editha]